MRRMLYGLVVIAVAGLVITGCTSPLSLVPDLIPETGGKSNLTFPLQMDHSTPPDNATSVALLAGQTEIVGAITVWNDQEYMYIRYGMLDGWSVVDTHVAVSGSATELPQTKKGNPIVGHFPYKASHDTNTATYTYVLPLGELVSSSEFDFVIAAHAEVHRAGVDSSGAETESAWADGHEFAGRNWAMYFEYTISTQQELEWILHTTTAERSRLHAADMLSATEGWAIGDYGRIYFYDGLDWALHTTTPQRQTLISIDMVSSSDGWAAGNNNLIYHYDGTSWALHTDFGGGGIRGIRMLSASYGWAVGYGGQIHHFDGTDWKLDTVTQEGSHLYAIDMLGEHDGWAVGKYGRIYHFDGEQWGLHATVAISQLMTVDMVTTDQGWAAGAAGQIYYYNGADWELHTETVAGSQIYSLEMVSASDGWACDNDGIIYHYDGTNWELHTSTLPGSRIAAIDMEATDSGWAVGSYGRIYHGSPK